MSSANARRRCRAWRARLASRSRLTRIDERVARAIAVEREYARRGDETSVPVAVAIAELADQRDERLREMYARRVTNMRARRHGASAAERDLLAARARELASCDPLNRWPSARIAAIVATSETVIAVDSAESPFVVSWLYTDESIETYRRVCAARAAREAVSRDECLRNADADRCHRAATEVRRGEQ